MPQLPLAADTQVGSTAWVVVSWIALVIAFVSAGAIVFDIAGRGYRQRMGIMDAVWPITALYWGPVAVWAYFNRGRRMSMKWAHERRVDIEDQPADDNEDPPSLRPFARKNWWPISKGVSHCGAGCTLGDIIGEWIVFLTAWSIPVFGVHDADTFAAMVVTDFVLAWSLGIVFQYFSIVPMREDVGRLEGVWQAIKADTLSIVSFQIGLFGYMALFHLVLWQPPLTVASPVYWFQMQIGMVIGFFTAWPVNAWLVKTGVKEKM
jgi:Co/Zn/Cd efflux system component